MVFLKRFYGFGLAACVLCLSCGDDQVNLPVVTKPDSPDIVSQNGSILPDEQASGFPQASDAVLVGENIGPVLGDAGRTSNAGVCVSYYRSLYALYYAMVPNANVVSQTCSQIELADTQTGNSLKVKLRGQCSLDIDLSTPNFDVDTTINVCGP